MTVDDDDFWALVGAARSAHSCELRARALRAALSHLPPTEIVDFDRRFRTALAALYTWELWAVAFVAQGGCGDDGFEYFRAGVIGRGRADFEAARRDPEAWALTLDPEEVETLECEDLLSVAAGAHEDATGSELPAPDVPHPLEPAGTGWDEDDLGTLHPRLAERHGWEAPDDGPELMVIGPSTPGGDVVAVDLADQADLLRVTEAYYRQDWEAAARIGAEIVATEPADPLLRGLAGAVAGQARFHLDDLDGSLEHLLPVLTDPEQRNGPALVLDDLCGFAYTAAMALFFRGRTDEARRLLLEAVAHTEERGADVPDRVDRALAQFDLAVGDYAAARARLGTTPPDWLLVAKAYASEDRREEAAEVLGQVEPQLTPDLMDHRTVAGLLAVAAEVRLLLDEPDTAIRHVDTAEGLLGPEDVGMPVVVDLALLRLAARRITGARDDLLGPLAEVERRARDATLTWTAAAARRERARVRRSLGDTDEARRLFAEAADAFEQGGYPAEAGTTRQEAGG